MPRPRLADKESSRARIALAERLFANGASNVEVCNELAARPSTIIRWRRDWERARNKDPKNIAPKPYRTGLVWGNSGFL